MWEEEVSAYATEIREGRVRRSDGSPRVAWAHEDP
jgi:hypothetical protein